MAKKTKKADKPKRKKITFKFTPKEGGRVRFAGLHFDEWAGVGEELPKTVVGVMEDYGLDTDSQGDWFDVLAPDMLSLEESMEYLSVAVPIRIQSKPTKTKRGKRTALFFVEFDRCGLSEDKDVYAALKKAFKEWNKQGRTINGVKLETALTKVLLVVNKDRV